MNTDEHRLEFAENMKRWIRRILMGCSITLMVAAVGLTIRGQFVQDVIFIRSLDVGNRRDCVVLIQRDYQRPLIRHFRGVPNDYGIVYVLPQMEIYSGETIVFIPHWTLLVIGTVYPGFVWLRRRNRNAAGGFPVEIEPRINADEPRL